VSAATQTRTLEHRRHIVALISLGVGAAVIGILHLLLAPSHAAAMILGHGGQSPYPLTVQNVMWLAFFGALGEVYVRYVTATAESSQLGKKYLPEDDTTVLQADDLKEIYRKVRASSAGEKCFLPRLIERCILQFQTSSSIEQSATLLNTSVEMFVHEIDLRYNMLRYLTWLMPTLGFIGTVIGIGLALSYAGEPGRMQDPALLTTVTGRLAVSFDATFLALVMTGIVLLFQNIVQSKEEHALNLAAQYCIDNLINRLYVVK
jgi:biopolymer transport protein ExbB/TolQ